MVLVAGYWRYGIGGGIYLSWVIILGALVVGYLNIGVGALVMGYWWWGVGDGVLVLRYL